MHETTSNDSMTAFTITPGFEERERPRIAALYWQAFGAKLGKLLGPEERALAFMAPNFHADHALVARDPNGNLLGLAGFKTANGAFLGGGFADLRACYGLLGALWRGPLLDLLERDLAPDTLLMDGIFVEKEARGLGIGTALLDAIKTEARDRDLSTVRLDVINTNPRARALYEREGFVPGATERIGPLRLLFGFEAYTAMTAPVK